MSSASKNCWLWESTLVRSDFSSKYSEAVEMKDLPRVSQKPIKIAREAISISRLFVVDLWLIKSDSAALKPVKNLV